MPRLLSEAIEFRIVIRADVESRLPDDVASVDAFIKVEEGEPALLEPLHQRPDQGVASAVPRQQGGMGTDATADRNAQHILRDQLRQSEDEDHIGRQSTNAVDRRLIRHTADSIKRYACLSCDWSEIGVVMVDPRRGRAGVQHGDHVGSAGDQLMQTILAETDRTHESDARRGQGPHSWWKAFINRRSSIGVSRSTSTIRAAA